MIRIASVTLNPKKQIRFALTPIKGIGKSNVKKVLLELALDGNALLESLDEQMVVKLRNYVENNFTLEADLRRTQQLNIKRLVDIACHRGLRHKAGLPVHGQTTRTNSRTRRGNQRKTAGSGHSKSADKT
jgi:small subunit ribosomal protein S13